MTTHKILGIAVVHKPPSDRQSGKIGRFQNGVLEITPIVEDATEVYRLRILIEGGTESVEIEVSASALRKIVNMAPRES